MTGAPLFADRADAGRRLARVLSHYATERPVVLALPRGGVPVGWEIARALHAPLDVVVARKLGAPGRPELGIGAVVDGDRPETVLNDDLVRALGVPRAHLDAEIERELAEVRRREVSYRGTRPPVACAGCTVIVVDDGVATGATMAAALRAIRRTAPRRVVLAVPVAPPDVAAALRAEADEVVCLATPTPFASVGRFYRDFAQVRDAKVVALLARAAVRNGTGPEQPRA